MATPHKLGTLEPVIYFVNHRDPAHPPGYILIAPMTDCPTPEGYSREGADTLADVDRLQTTLQRQEVAAAEREMAYDDTLVAAKFAEVRDRLTARMVSSATHPYEREFIAAYLRLRDDRRSEFQRRFLCDVAARACLWARENDIPRNRGAGEERVSLDRVNF